MAFVGMTLACAGCADGTDDDPLRMAGDLPATAATAPPRSVAPAGRVLAVGGPATAAVVDPATRTLAVAAGGPDRLLLYDLGQPDAAPRAVALPGEVARLGLGGPGELLAPVPTRNALLRIGLSSAPSGAEPTVRTVELAGAPAAAAVVGAHTVVALGDRVVVLDGDTVSRTITGFAGAAEIVAVGDQAAVLDRPRSALLTLDPVTGRLGPGLRAGDGATNATGDRHGRVLVTDTRDGELLAFGIQPMIMRQRYPVPGAPYAIAYDRARDLAWVTLTEHNEVVGFDVAGGEPVQRYRLSTVRQPNAVAVDGATGAVVVASGTGEGIQVVQP